VQRVRAGVLFAERVADRIGCGSWAGFDKFDCEFGRIRGALRRRMDKPKDRKLVRRAGRGRYIAVCLCDAGAASAQEIAGFAKQIVMRGVHRSWEVEA